MDNEPASLGGAKETYFYDGNGKRVGKSDSGGPQTVYFYDAFGQLAAEYANVASSAPCTTCYLSYGGGLSFLYSPGLNDLSNASEQQYAQGVNSAFYGNLANEYAQNGNVTAAKQVAALSGGSVTVSDVKNTVTYTDKFRGGYRDAEL